MQNDMRGNGCIGKKGIAEDCGRVDGPGAPSYDLSTRQENE
jgi:hypothetical protein